MSRFLQTAFDAIKIAEKITLKYYYGKVKFQSKSDGSPVTEADTSAEHAITKLIKKRFPDHGFYGEEYGKTNIHRDYIWLIDPIDGTKNFIDQIPLWGTLIALIHKQKVILGVSHVPLMKELLWAEKGKGAFLNGKRVQVSKINHLNEAMISFGSITSFKEKGRQTRLIKLANDCLRQRAFGDLWPYHLLASGKVDIVTEAWIKPVDVAPFAVIIDEAGGKASDLDGKPFSFNTSSFIGTNGKLHTSALKYFKK